MQLCAGATSTAPADCGILAYNGPYNLDQAVKLCTGAYTTGPALCGIKAYNGPFSLDQSVQLCSFPSATEATANCAITAYNGPYTLDQAVQMCRGNKTSALRSRVSELNKADVNELLRAANIKAVHEGVYKK